LLTPVRPTPASGQPGLVVTCEHGGQRIPTAYRHLFAGHQALLDSHRGFDPGALRLARDLAIGLQAPLIYATVSRLLVDLNRSVGNPSLHGFMVPAQPPDLRAAIIEHFYRPYRQKAETAIQTAIRTHGWALHISAHSFTPVLDGQVRNADVGLLYDPSRPTEAALARHWKAGLARQAPHLRVRRNYPYAGKGDGLTRSLRQQWPTDLYTGIELEINQHFPLSNTQQWPALRQLLVSTLQQAIIATYRLTSTRYFPCKSELAST
jgi:predicted N-formylglutamate amidohydrolase